MCRSLFFPSPIFKILGTAPFEDLSTTEIKTTTYTTQEQMTTSPQNRISMYTQSYLSSMSSRLFPYTDMA